MSLQRRTPLARSTINPRRPTPRRREAPRWTPEQWWEASCLLMTRGGARCDACGQFLAGEPMERHHRQRRRDGGDRLGNILLLHRRCHQYWTQHPALARASGLIVSMSADPLLVPVLWHGVAWVLLDDVGGMSASSPPH